MRILLTVENLVELAGSKLYVRTLADAFLRPSFHFDDTYGGFDKVDHTHQVTIAAVGKITGPMRDELCGLDVEIVQIADLTEGFDVGIISPYSARDAGISCQRVINVVHGVVDAERPIPKADHYVYISEESYWHWRREEHTASEHVIRNAVDLSRYRPCAKARQQLECVAHFSNYSDLPELQWYCNVHGIRFPRIKDKPYAEVLDLLRDADLVFAVGRAAYEAMAVGCEVAFCDNRGYYESEGGWCDGLASETYLDARLFNCSGRSTKEKVDTTLYRMLFSRYSSRAALINRQLIADYHDSTKITAQILHLIK